MLYQSRRSTLANVLAQRVRKVSGKQKSRDESRLAQSDGVKSRAGSLRCLPLGARGNSCLIDRRARVFVAIVPGIGRPIAHMQPFLVCARHGGARPRRRRVVGRDAVKAVDGIAGGESWGGEAARS